MMPSPVDQSLRRHSSALLRRSGGTPPHTPARQRTRAEESALVAQLVSETAAPESVVRMLLERYGGDADRVRHRLLPTEDDAASSRSEVAPEVQEARAICYDVASVLVLGFLTHPIDRARTLQQARGVGVVEAWRMALDCGGGMSVLPLWRGFPAFVLRTVPEAIVASKLFGVSQMLLAPDAGWQNVAPEDAERIALVAFAAVQLICAVPDQPLWCMSVHLRLCQGPLTLKRWLECIAEPARVRGPWGYTSGLGCSIAVGMVEWFSATCLTWTLVCRRCMRRRRREPPPPPPDFRQEDSPAGTPLEMVTPYTPSDFERGRQSPPEQPAAAPPQPTVSAWSNVSILGVADFCTLFPAVPLVNMLTTARILFAANQEYNSMFKMVYDGLVHGEGPVREGVGVLMRGFAMEVAIRISSSLIMAAFDRCYSRFRGRFNRFFDKFVGWI
eukprot:TRINITY_DN21468_c0_g1_i1.p2 TRINITY_DN21468_c0_g1~~TRINITY_DN21468_c0_g1_i1.p2  ORF type:complete len:444 (+),score=111.51 TRINITY_DN21468_c0_g1_i1:64-1395(+)